MRDIHQHHQRRVVSKHTAGAPTRRVRARASWATCGCMSRPVPSTAHAQREAEDHEIAATS